MDPVILITGCCDKVLVYIGGCNYQGMMLSLALGDSKGDFAQ